MNNDDNSKSVITAKRKQRRVKNPYIDIDNVSIEAGDDYENWIVLTKEKLKERERILMTVRIQTLQNIINKQCKVFEAIHDEKINVYNSDKIQLTEIIDGCLNKLYLSLQLWNGVNLTKTKKSLSTFRKYFVIGKCWFDQQKKYILAPEFWIKLFFILEEFTMNTASMFFNDRFEDLQKLYSKHLLLIIICGIFSGQLHFASTKPQPLIPCGILKDSDPMKQYLAQNLHSSLNIHSLTQQYKSNISSNNSSKNVNAKEILELVNKQLLYLTNQARDQFQEQFQAFLGDMKNTNSINTMKNTTNSMLNATDCTASTSFILSSADNNNNNGNNRNIKIRPPTFNKPGIKKQSVVPLPSLPIIRQHDEQKQQQQHQQHQQSSVDMRVRHPFQAPSMYNQQQQQHQGSQSMYSYSGNHCSSQSVMFNRFNPIQSVHSSPQQNNSCIELIDSNNSVISTQSSSNNNVNINQYNNYNNNNYNNYDSNNCDNINYNNNYNQFNNNNNMNNTNNNNMNYSHNNNNNNY